MMRMPNILLLADTKHHTGAVRDHIEAVIASPGIQWHVINPILCKTLDKCDFSMFDAIGLHYSIKPYNYYYLSRALQQKIAEYRGTKFLFLQDEYQKVNQVQDYLYRLGFHLLFTLVQQSMVDEAYPDPRLSKLRKVQVLTGYVSDSMRQLVSPPLASRTIDVAYRGRRCDYWLGSLAYEKEKIAHEFVKRTQGLGLRLDISVEESDRVYGNAWWQFLMNARAVLGTESGASIWDFDGSARKATKHFLKKHKQASFEQIYQQALKPYDGLFLYSAVSPRVFEAAAAKTPMILFPGAYSGVCKAHEHYIVLEKDFSNLGDVIVKLKDLDYLEAMAERAYQDLIVADTYSRKCFSELISHEVLAMVQQRQYHTLASVENAMMAQLRKYRVLNRVRCIDTELRFVIANGYALLCDPTLTMSHKMSMISNGIRRYFAYLLPRLR